jgi:hypothetical protein
MTRTTSVGSITSILSGVLLLAIGLVPARAGLVSGDIAVYNGSSLLGYVSDAYDGQNTFTYTTNMAQALTVEFDSSASAPFSITTLNPPGSNTYFGAVGGSGGYHFASGNSGYAYLSDTSLVAAGSHPSGSATNDIQSLGYNAPSESTIWSRSGNVLTAQWVNSDGSQNPTQTIYDPVVDYLAITGDLTTYNNAFGDNAEAVTFKFTGTLPTSAVPEPGVYALLGSLGLTGAALLRRRRAR